MVCDSGAEEWRDPQEMVLPYADLYLEVHNGEDRGNEARTRGIEAATGTHLAFMDDDDCYLPGALELMRTCAPPDRPVIFRMQHHPWQVVIPFENEWGILKFGNVGTPCFVVPNLPDKLGVWTPWDNDSGSDFSFIKGCCDNMGDPIFRREIISVIRPHEKVLSSG